MEDYLENSEFTYVMEMTGLDTHGKNKIKKIVAKKKGGKMRQI